MRWKGRRRSENVEDRRSMAPAAAGAGGIGVIIMALIAMYMGQDPQQVVQQLNARRKAAVQQQGGRKTTPEEDELADMVTVVLADTEDVWNRLFQEMGKRYREPHLVLFSGSVESACGHASAAVGPFYCPGDQKVYIDLSFYDDLRTRHKAPGDFAQAYVVAHEIGHHVQNLLGISEQVQRAKQRTSRAEANQLSVRLELQADCLAGVWAHHAHRERQLLEPGDIEEGLRAAAAIGDDAIQTRTAGYTRPETWTHGSSKQRVSWLRRGLESGDPNTCETFG